MGGFEKVEYIARSRSEAKASTIRNLYRFCKQSFLALHSNPVKVNFLSFSLVPVGIEFSRLLSKCAILSVYGRRSNDFCAGVHIPDWRRIWVLGGDVF